MNRVAFPSPNRWRATVWRLRWVLIILAALLAVRVMVPAVVGAVRDTAPALTLAHAVTAGTVLTAADVAIVQVASGLVPSGVLSRADQAVGQQVMAALPTGMALVPELLAEPSALANAPPGTVVVPVRLSDGAAARLLHVGDRIDLFASAGASASGGIVPAERLADAALVLELPAQDANGAGLIIMALTPDEAALVSGATSWSVLSAVIVG